MCLFPNRKTLLNNFSLCENQEDRYIYLIELGKKLPIIEENLKTNNNRVFGCQSYTWIFLEFEKNKLKKIVGDSDSLIVKGLIVVLAILFKDMTLRKILENKNKNFFHKLSLYKDLTPSRNQGLYLMIEFIHSKIRKFIFYSKEKNL
ncbi:hypothetical protein AOQ88_00390 [Candidatus Riesia sp. GBBU]|nr:hypothetical protein AOQ88_00390 [Candidatus Riesia sp. GBBU]